MKLFHGSLCDNITVFNPISHFADKPECALAAVAAKYFTPENKLVKAAAWMYEFDFPLAEAEILDTPDFGTPTAQALLVGLGGIGDPVITAQTDSYCSALNQMRGQFIPKDQVLAQALIYANALMSGLNKKALRYENEVESAGFISICVLDCSTMQPGAPRKLSSQELREGFNLLSTSRQGHLIHPNNW